MTAHAPFISQAHSTADTNYIGKTTVATSGTAVQITSTQTQITSVVIKALSANTGIVYVWNASGNGKTSGFELNAKEAVALAISDLSSVWIDAVNNGEGVCYIAS